MKRKRSVIACLVIGLPSPEHTPLIVVICTEDLPLSILVQLFSSPQQQAAASIWSALCVPAGACPEGY